MLALICLLHSTSAWCAETKIDLSQPLPRLRLPDGRILQKVTFVKFNTLDIFIRHSAGSMALLYEALPDEVRAVAEQKRPGGPRWYPGDTSNNGVQVEGQVFVQTRGAGPYKFGEATVYAFAAQYLDAWKSIGFDGIVKLPKPLAVAQTDADGRFKLSVPAETPYFLFCQTSRLIGNSTEYNEWRVPSDQFKNAKQANLTGENQSQRSAKVEIEPVQ